LESETVDAILLIITETRVSKWFTVTQYQLFYRYSLASPL
jgi:hypothetical protein